jgi:hypothetical protein
MLAFAVRGKKRCAQENGQRDKAGFDLIRKRARGAASQLSVGFASDITVTPA